MSNHGRGPVRARKRGPERGCLIKRNLPEESGGAAATVRGGGPGRNEGLTVSLVAHVSRSGQDTGGESKRLSRCLGLARRVLPETCMWKPGQERDGGESLRRSEWRKRRWRGGWLVWKAANGRRDSLRLRHGILYGESRIRQEGEAVQLPACTLGAADASRVTGAPKCSTASR